MCLIIHKGADVEVPLELRRAAYEGNGDGFGVMWLDDTDGRVKVDKVLPKRFEDTEAVYERYKDREVALHYRLQTVGTICEENVHPFRVLDKDADGQDLWLMHNGTMTDVPVGWDKDASDTAHFIKYVLRPMLLNRPEAMGDKKFWSFVKRMIGSSRLLMLDGDGEYLRVENGGTKWVQHKGLWLSNKYSVQREGQAEPYDFGDRPAYTQYGGYYGYQNGGSVGNGHAAGVVKRAIVLPGAAGSVDRMKKRVGIIKYGTVRVTEMGVNPMLNCRMHDLRGLLDRPVAPVDSVGEASFREASGPGMRGLPSGLVGTCDLGAECRKCVLWRAEACGTIKHSQFGTMVGAVKPPVIEVVDCDEDEASEGDQPEEWTCYNYVFEDWEDDGVEMITKLGADPFTPGGIVTSEVVSEIFDMDDEQSSGDDSVGMEMMRDLVESNPAGVAQYLWGYLDYFGREYGE